MARCYAFCQCATMTCRVPSINTSSKDAAVYEYTKHKHECELDAYGDLIETELAKRPPQSAKEAGAVIEELTCIKRSPTQIREFLKKRDQVLENGKYSLQSQSDASERVFGEHGRAFDLVPTPSRCTNSRRPKAW